MKNNNINKGLLVAVEGMDGAGKTVIVEKLKSRLQDSGVTVEVVRQPGGTAMADDIAGVFKAQYDEHVHPLSEYFLICAARKQAYEHRIRPALQQGAVVIADRYWHSTHSYQGMVLGHVDKMVSPHADIQVLVKAEFDTCIERIRVRNDNCRIEQLPVEHLKSIYRSIYKAVDKPPYSQQLTIDANNFKASSYRKGIEAAAQHIIKAHRSKLVGGNQLTA